MEQIEEIVPVRPLRLPDWIYVDPFKQINPIVRRIML